MKNNKVSLNNQNNLKYQKFQSDLKIRDIQYSQIRREKVNVLNVIGQKVFKFEIYKFQAF